MPDVERPRFGQLTYTSFDRPDAATGGGWQVKEVSGELDPAEEEALRAGVLTRFETASPLPRFPSPEEIEDRPRRLMYTVGKHGGMYWHTVPAGPDASGRPGNVFAHALVDRRTSEASRARPIERWRSPDWLVPYGAEQVAAATLPADEPRPGDAVSREAVLAFLLAPDTWRIGIFGVLLDAVARALEGGPPVVLGCQDQSSAALWIAAVSQFMSPGTCHRFGWSTFDRLHSVDDAIARGAHLSAVPLDDLPGDAPGCVVFGESESPEIGELDGDPHCVANGDLVPVSPWSLLAQTVLIDAVVAARALAQQDEIAAEVGDRGLNPMWPLAMAVVANSELHDALDEATTVLLEHSPESVSGTDFERLIVDVIDHNLGETTEHAAQALARWQSDGTLAQVVRNLAGTVFVYRVFRDPEWVRRAAPSRLALVEHCCRTTELLADAGRVLDGLRRRARAAMHPDDLATEALRHVDLVVRAGLDDDRSADVIVELLDLTVVPVLCDPDRGAAFVAAIDTLADSTRIDYLQHAVVTSTEFTTRPLGSRLVPAVIAWLGGTLPGPPRFDDFVADRSLVDTPQCALIAEGVFVLAGDGQRVRPELGTVALWRALAELDRGTIASAHLDAVVDGVSWTPAQWRSAIAQYPCAVAPRFLADTIIHAGWSEHVEDLGRHLGDVLRGGLPELLIPTSQRDVLVLSWAAIRLQETWDNISAGAFRRAIETHGLPVLTDYATDRPAELADDLLARLAVFVVAARGCGVGIRPLPSTHEDALVEAVVRNADYVVEALVALVYSGAIDENRLIADAVTAYRDAQNARDSADSVDLHSRFEIGDPPRRRTVLDEVVNRILAESWYRGPRSAAEALAVIPVEPWDQARRDVWRVVVEGWFEQRRRDVHQAAVEHRRTPR